MIYFKAHETDKGMIIAMCDEELLGRAFSEGKRELDLKKYAEFYNGELVTEQEAKARIKDDLYTANIVGKRSVEIFIEKGLAQKSDVITVQKVPFIQVFKMI